MLKLKLQYSGQTAKNWLIWKDHNAREGWRQEEKGTTEDEVGWMAPLTQWSWVWVNSGSWWWTGRPAVLQSMGSQKVGNAWATRLNWTDQKNFQSVAVVKNPPANAGDARDTDSIPGLRNYPEGGKGIHSIILAWEIPWTEEPGGLWSMRLQKVRHNWAHVHTYTRTHTHIHIHLISNVF